MKYKIETVDDLSNEYALHKIIRIVTEKSHNNTFGIKVGPVQEMRQLSTGEYVASVSTSASVWLSGNGWVPVVSVDDRTEPLDERPVQREEYDKHLKWCMDQMENISVELIRVALEVVYGETMEEKVDGQS